MKPISRVSTATDENKETRGQDRNTTPEEKSSMRSSSEPNFPGSSMGTFADRAQEVASNALGKAQEYGETAIHETGSFVRRYPAQTLLAGLGVGLLVGWAVSRR